MFHTEYLNSEAVSVGPVENHRYKNGVWDHFLNGLFINWDGGGEYFLIIKMGDLEGGEYCY